MRDPGDEASGEGVYHTVELNAVWGWNNTDGNPPASYKPGGVNQYISGVVQPYWINFVKGLDPNGDKGDGRVEWEVWGEGSWLRFETNITAMERDRGEEGRCLILDPLVRVLEQVPPAGTVTELKWR